MLRRSFSGFASLFLIGVCFGPAVCFGQAPKFTISTVAGKGVAGFSGDGGPATAANLKVSRRAAFDSAGNLYIADSFNNRIRKVDTNGTISTFAGTGDFGDFGDTNVATKAGLNRPYGVAFDKAGNLYIADTYNDVIRKVASGGTISTFAGRSVEGLGGDGGGATGALLDTPTAVVLDAAGNLYIADTQNNRIRKVGTDGNISTFAGTGGPGFHRRRRTSRQRLVESPRGARHRQTRQPLRRGHGQPPGPENRPGRHDYHRGRKRKRGVPRRRGSGYPGQSLLSKGHSGGPFFRESIYRGLA